MCGIVGLLIKIPSLRDQLGELMVPVEAAAMAGVPLAGTSWIPGQGAPTP